MKMKLKGHQKFVLREGWIYKGLKSVHDDNKIFSSSKAADEMGVGNNMVMSIKYWLTAFGLIKYSSKYGYTLTDLGTIIYENDPFLEMNFTICLLHYNLVINLENATSWYIFFNKCDIEYINKAELRVRMASEIREIYGDISYAPSSLDSDINVLLNMYCKEKTDDPENNRFSPLSELKLIYEKNDNYYKQQINKSELDILMVLYVLLKFKENENLSSISIDDLYKKEKGLGCIFNLNRVNINVYLDELENSNYIKVNRTAGLDSIIPITKLNSYDIIKKYYKEQNEG